MKRRLFKQIFLSSLTVLVLTLCVLFFFAARNIREDTGIGIPEEDLPRIFERFYRVDKSHSKEVGGTGLGLSIVKHCALYHSAEIHVSSHLGQGTAVTICFPVERGN